MRRLLREHQPASDQACAALQTWLLAHPALRTIAVYSPLPGEVDLSPTLLRRAETRWVFPKIRGADLTFHSGLNLVSGAFGILEPAAGSPEVALAEIDAFICPGLAFDPRGGRLGRGRGFYDRMLANARPDALKLGICFEIQLVADTFPEPHDVRMDHVIAG
jgi:5-formyltetrahydrofolate cyclo-ligase